MTIKELIEDFGFGNSQSTIQREAKLNNYIGKQVEIICHIGDITNYSIQIGQLMWGNNFTSHSFALKLVFDKEKFGQQLLKYFFDDKVKIIAILRLVDLSTRDPSYEFELFSIDKLKK